jgi:SAM-dependent methyltransferase/catechol 2,3-dioxygenase-like lactoylglutathione lyase family enzyme
MTLFILYVSDPARSRDFYRRALAVEPALDVPGMTEFALPGGARLGLMPESGIRRLLGDVLPDPARGRGVPRAEVYLRVDDPERHHARALAAGAVELNPVAPRDWGERAGYALDPDGHVIAFAGGIPAARGTAPAPAIDVAAHNRDAWDREVAKGNRWTVPMSAETIAAAREGRWEVVLTPVKPVPREWFGDLAGRSVLALASGGGQQAPILAAAGANVTLLDNSPAQLARDRAVAERDGLPLRLELGDMRDLGRFAGGAFDLIFHPVSNLFVPDVRPVWRECFRVLRPGGRLLAGFANPVLYLFDDPETAGGLVARHALPYSDLAALPPATLARRIADGEPLEYGHTLEDQIGGQLDAGFALEAMYEDGWPDHALGRLMQPFLATRSARPART